MINILWNEAFKRRYKKLVKNNVELKTIFWELIKVLSENPFEPKLKAHKLTRNKKDFSHSTLKIYEPKQFIEAYL